METFSFIFPIFFFLIFGYIIFSVFTIKGRDFTIDKFIGKIIKDYGVISEEKIFLMNQKARLLKCKKNNSEFYVIEITNNSLLSKQLHYLKLTQESAMKLSTLLRG